METVRTYILSVICAALISGILTDLTRKTFFAKQLKLVCSLFLASTCLMPLISLQLPDPTQIGYSFSSQAQDAIRKGKQMRIQSVAGIIKEQAEAYVLEEARSIGVEITVEIELEYKDPPVPVSSTVRGCFDASSESTLSRILTQKLGIPKENQTWIRQETRKSDSS